MKTYLDVLGEISFIWWVLPILFMWIMLLVCISHDWGYSRFVLKFSTTLSLIIGISFNLLWSFGDMEEYNNNYFTCHKQVALKAGYKMIDNKCYKPYSGFIPVNESGK